MGFLKRLFGSDKNEGYVDKQGVYFYVRCNNCGSIVRLRADKQYDLENTGGGYMWHKTIVDNKCFRQIPAVVTLNGSYEIENADIQGGEFVTEADYERQQKETAVQTELARREAEQTDAKSNPEPDNETDIS